MNNIETKWMQFHSKHLQERKLRFVTWFDKKFTGKYCWADCVSWAFDWRRFNPFKIEGSEACKKESQTNLYSCYCGGWEEGRCFDLLSEEQKNAIREHIEIIQSGKEDLPF